MGFFSGIFNRKKREEVSELLPQPEQLGSGGYTLEEAEVIEQMGQRHVDIVRGSIEIARESVNPDTKLSRVDLAKQKLQELKDLTSQYPSASIMGLEAVEEAILELEQDTCGFSEYVEIVALGKSLEKQGCIEEAIEAYEKLVQKKIDVPLPYRRLAILYRKTKNDTGELRIIDEALKNLPESTMGNHYTWFQDRLNKKIKSNMTV